MRRLVTQSVALTLIVWPAAVILAASEEPASNSEQRVTVTRNLTSMPLAFTENRGQWDEQALFRANAGGATMWFTTEGVVYQFTRSLPTEDEDVPRNGVEGDDPIRFHLDRLDREPRSVEQLVIKSKFVGANPSPRVFGEEKLEYKCNYFIGNDPTKWRTDVPNYEAIVFEDVYAGIDLKYYGNGKQMEYDFIVSPGADYAQIQIEYEGAKSLSVNEVGELVVETDWGTVTELKPLVYQVEDGERQPLNAKYTLLSGNSFGFQLPQGYNCQLALVIDPVLTYSTYLGGSDWDSGDYIAVDASGCAYVTGQTLSTDFPTVGEYQTDQGSWDAFVTKLNSAGNGLVYSTYLGGSIDNYGYGISVDGSGNAYVTGQTTSSDFPTEGEYQTDQGGCDAFVTKLNSSGNALVYSTYLGGSDWDSGYGISVDGSGHAYVTGRTLSDDFPTEGEYQTDQPYCDAFVTKLNSAGNGLVYSTYLGGSTDDYGYGISVDGSGNAYVTGHTYSSDFPTEGEYQTDQPYWDAFVTKLNSTGNDLVYSTYLGGSGHEYGHGIAVDGSGNAYITGLTSSSDFPTEGAYQADYGGGSCDAFVTKLNSTGNGLVYSTYLGGGRNDSGYGITVDGSGNAYVTGHTNSTDFPTEGEYQTYQGYADAFVTKLNSTGNALVYSTYLGGSHYDDDSFGIAVDGSGNAYVTGYTYSSDFPTEGEYQTYQGYVDAFVTKFDCCVGQVGDANNSGDHEPTIGDITALIDAKFITGACDGVIDCIVEADVNQTGGLYATCDDLTIGDITMLIDYLFITGKDNWDEGYGLGNLAPCL